MGSWLFDKLLFDPLFFTSSTTFSFWEALVFTSLLVEFSTVETFFLVNSLLTISSCWLISIFKKLGYLSFIAINWSLVICNFSHNKLLCSISFAKTPELFCAEEFKFSTLVSWDFWILFTFNLLISKFI